MLNKIVLLIFLFLSIDSMAASCCGGGGGTTKIMLGDTEKVFRFSYLDRTILADQGQELTSLRANDELESIRSLNISTSIRFYESWQYGLMLKGVSKTKKVLGSNESYSGLGDTEFNVAYEFMPEISRNSFLSQGFVYSKLQIPTGKSLFTTKRVDTLDTVGTGHYLVSLGTVFTKRYRKGMTTATIGLGYRPSRSFESTMFTDDEVKTKPSFNYDLSLTQSLDILSNLSAELGLSRTYYSNLATSVFSGRDQSSALNSMSLSASYITDDLDFTLTYTDDFLVGESYNNVLGRSIELGLIKKVNL